MLSVYECEISQIHKGMLWKHTIRCFYENIFSYACHALGVAKAKVIAFNFLFLIGIYTYSSQKVCIFLGVISFHRQRSHKMHSLCQWPSLQERISQTLKKFNEKNMSPLLCSPFKQNKKCRMTCPPLPVLFPRSMKKEKGKRVEGRLTRYNLASCSLLAPSVTGCWEASIDMGWKTLQGFWLGRCMHAKIIASLLGCPAMLNPNRLTCCAVDETMCFFWKHYIHAPLPQQSRFFFP